MISKTGLRKAAITAFAAFAIAAPASQAATPAVLDGLQGKWSGSGSAYLSSMGNISAKCSLNVNDAASGVSMQGKCGTLVFSKGLGITLRSAGGNRVTGVYSGSKTGPAKLDGTISGNQLKLNVVWAGDVNGDRKANMILQRSGPDTFVQTVTDHVDGKLTTTSKFTFKRR